MVEDRHIVGREGSDAPVATLLEIGLQILEPLEEHAEGLAVVLGEPLVGLVGVSEMAVGLNLGGIADRDRDRAALQTRSADPFGRVPGVGVDVVLDHLAVVAVHGRVHQLDVQHRCVFAVGGAVVDPGRHPDLALEEPPVRPHGVIVRNVTVGVDDVERVGSTEPFPMAGRPRSRADDDLITGDRAGGGFDRLHGAAAHTAAGARRCIARTHVVAGDLDAIDALHSPLLTLLVEAPHHHVGARVPRSVFVEHDIALVGLEVGPDRGQEPMRVVTGVEVARVTGIDLALVELDVVLGLVLFADRHIPDLLETEVDRVGLPHFDAGSQDRVERAGHVQVADTAAGETGGTSAGPLLVDQDDIAALPLAAALERHGQVVGGGQTVNSGTDDHIARTRRQGGDIAQRNDRRVLQDPIDLFRQGAIHERIPLVVTCGVGTGIREIHGRNVRTRPCAGKGLEPGPRRVGQRPGNRSPVAESGPDGVNQDRADRRLPRQITRLRV